MKKVIRRMARAIAFMGLVTLLLTAAACQPTPEEPVIVGKNDGALEEIMQQTPAATFEPYQAPAHWSETVEEDKLTIEIDTDIALRDASAYPVVKVEPVVFSQEQVNALVNYFAAGKKFYEPPVQTKADFEAQIVEAMRGHDVDGEYVFDESDQEWVDQLKEKMAAAPADSARIYADTTLTYRTDYETREEDTAGGKNYIGVSVENADGNDGSISFANYVPGFSHATRFGFTAKDDQGYLSETTYDQWMKESEQSVEDDSMRGYEGYEALYDQVAMMEEEATAQGQKILGDLGITGMALVDSSRLASGKYPDKGGYELKYMRESGSITGYQLTGGGSMNEEPPQYSPPFTLETVTIRLTEDGILSFYWNGCANVVETVSENVALLPFDKVQQALKDQIKYKKSFGEIEQYGMEDFAVTVTSAELRVSYIGVKDNPGQALLIPVWVFGTEFSWQNNVLQREQRYTDDDYVFNAIDGGVVDYDWVKIHNEMMEEADD